MYADASALVKCVVREPESEALGEYLAAGEVLLASSRISLVEVRRAIEVANPSEEARERARQLVESCHLVDVTDALLRAAADLVSPALKTLDAIHLATASSVEPDEMLVYDKRLREAAAAAGLRVARPGT